MKKIVFLVFLIFLSQAAFAAIPAKINFQGVLKNSSGSLVTDPALTVVFSVYAGAAGGTALWSETQSVAVEGGLYNVQLGSVTPIPADGTVFDGSTRYLSIKAGTDSEMTPRLPMISVPYAYLAQSAGTADAAGNADRVGSYAAAATGSGSFVPVTSSGKLDSSVIPFTGASVAYAASAGTSDTSGLATNATHAATADTAGTADAAGNADAVDGYSASSTPTANTLLPLNTYGGLIISTAGSIDGLSVTNSINSTGGRAIYGRASHSGNTYVHGIRGETASKGSNCAGVWGEATNADGDAYACGGWFKSNDIHGTGVVGQGHCGVRGIGADTGYSAYFSGGTGVVIQDGNFVVSAPTVPANAGSTGRTGQIAWNSNYIYICIDTNTWKRVAISTW